MKKFEAMRKQNQCLMYLRRRSIAVLILLVILFYFIPYLIYQIGLFPAQVKYSVIKSNENNEWKDLIVPQSADIQDDNNILNRTKYSIELLHFLGLNTSTINSINSFNDIILLFGCQTVIGTEFINFFENLKKDKKILLIKIRSLVDIDFTSPDVFLLFQHLQTKIHKAIIIYQPLYLFENAEKDGSKRIEEIISDELNGIQNFLNKMNINGTFIIPPPHFKVYQTIIEKSIVFFTPHFIDIKNIQDPKNLLNKVIFQCKMSNESEMTYYENNRNNEYLSYLPVHEFVSFIYFNLINDLKFEKKKYLIETKNETKIQKSKEIIDNLMSNEFKINCQIDLKMSPHKSIEFIDFENIQKIELDHSIQNEEEKNKIIRKSIKNLFYISNKTYLSIVFTGRNDDYGKGFIERAKFFLFFLYKTINGIHSIVNIEVIIVDYATDESRDPFHSLFDDHLNELKRKFKNKNEIKIRFIQVPPKFHKKIVEAKVPFLEYFAKNIGIRRAKGEFVLAMNPDSLLSRNFFELVSNKLFNPGFLYTSTRVDMSEEDSENEEKKKKFIHIIFEEPAIISYDSPLNPLNNYKQIVKKKHFNKMEYIKINFNYDWGFGDFQMLSKNMWDAINGFNQFPTNTYVDNLLFAKMLKIRPGSFSMNLPTPITHQYHTHMSSKRPHNIDMVNNSMIEYEKFGKISEKTDIENWGYPNEYFPEVIYVI